MSELAGDKALSANTITVTGQPALCAWNSVFTVQPAKPQLYTFLESSNEKFSRLVLHFVEI